jgi:hypothetical protein
MAVRSRRDHESLLPKGGKEPGNVADEWRQALIDFKHLDNENWISQRHGYKPPAPVRPEHLQALALAV